MKSTTAGSARSTRRSIPFHGLEAADPRLKRETDYYYLPETSMLIDDVQLYVLPVPDERYEIKLHSSDERVRALFTGAIRTQFERLDLSDSLYYFFRECAGAIMAHRFAAYEIAYLLDAETVVGFELVLIPPTSFVLRGTTFRQYVPAEIRSDRGTSDKYIDLPTESVLLFQLPEYVRAEHEQTMESLASIGNNLFPKFAIENLYRRTVPFHQDNYLLTREVALAKATQSLGWNARHYGTEYKFEHYVWRRQLTFYKFICLMRQLILDGLNIALSRVGERMGFEAHLTIDGLPTASDAEVALRRLQDGDLRTFDDVLKQYK